MKRIVSALVVFLMVAVSAFAQSEGAREYTFPSSIGTIYLWIDQEVYKHHSVHSPTFRDHGFSIWTNRETAKKLGLDEKGGLVAEFMMKRGEKWEVVETVVPSWKSSTDSMLLLFDSRKQFHGARLRWTDVRR